VPPQPSSPHCFCWHCRAQHWKARQTNPAAQPGGQLLPQPSSPHALPAQEHVSTQVPEDEQLWSGGQAPQLLPQASTPHCLGPQLQE
jgi:hypothetical protein